MATDAAAATAAPAERNADCLICYCALNAGERLAVLKPCGGPFDPAVLDAENSAIASARRRARHALTRNRNSESESRDSDPELTSAIDADQGLALMAGRSGRGGRGGRCYSQLQGRAG